MATRSNVLSYGLAPYLAPETTSSFELHTLCTWGAAAPHLPEECMCARLIKSATTTPDGAMVIVYTLDPAATTVEFWEATIWVATQPGTDLVLGEHCWRYALSQC